LFGFVVEEKDQRAKGWECDSWTSCSWRRASLWSCSRLCFIQRHFHSRDWFVWTGNTCSHHW